MFLKNRNISSKIKRSKVTDYAALTAYCQSYFNKFMPTCSDFFLNLLSTKSTLSAGFINDGSPILDKQVTSNIIVGDGVGLWGRALISFYTYFICIQETSS